MFRFFLTILLFLTANHAFCINIITGRVVAIADGDTFTILTSEKKQVKIRLHGVDCPEAKQDFGYKAQQFTASLCFNKTVRAEIKNTDRYGRKVAVVSLLDGRVINKELLKSGYAWHYKFYDKSPEFALLERQARLKKIGLWSNNSAVAPWDFRKKKRYGDKENLKYQIKKTEYSNCGAKTNSGTDCKIRVQKGKTCWHHRPGT